jgi:DNA primase catalytic core
LGGFSDNAKERIRERIDMVALVSEYVQLKRRGPDDFWGCCPFHDEKSPSFHIRPERGVYKCFGCGKGGDVFRFVEETEGLTFREALERLASRAGVEVAAASPQERERRAQREAWFRTSALAAEFFEATLWSDSPAGEIGRKTLQDRGITEETARAFGIGVAPDGWDALLREAHNRNLPIQALLDLGLLRQKGMGAKPYDFFRNRLMFPIKDEQGKVRGFGGRTLDGDERKYVNSPEVKGFYEKRQILYGLDRARKARAKRLVVVEGYMDVVIPHQVGQTEFVAALGTAFTIEQAKLAKRYVDEVVLLFDGDEAGAAATLKALANLVGVEGLSVRVARLPKGMDPDEAVQENPELLTSALENAEDLIGFVIAQAMVGYDSATGAGRKRVVEASIRLLARIPDRIRLFQELGVVAQRFGLPEQVLRDAMSAEKQSAANSERTRRERSARRGGGQQGGPQGGGYQGGGRTQGGRDGYSNRNQNGGFKKKGFKKDGKKWRKGGDDVPAAGPLRPLGSDRPAALVREEYLLEALMGMPEVATRLLGEGYGPQDFNPGPCQRVAGAIFALAGEGRLQPATVMGLLEEPRARDLCSRLIGRMDAENKNYERELSGMAALRNARLRARQEEVTRAIRGTQDKETKTRLLAELTRLRAQLQQGPVAAEAH